MGKLLGLLFVVAVVAFIYKLLISKLNQSEDESVQDLSVYEKKPYLFDTNSEFALYKVLLEIFGEDYFIFPEVNYSHLIQPKKSTWAEERKYRSRIDRKSADFVFCDKQNIVPRLVIELDGSAHNLKSKIERDEFINEITKVVGLPILHLENGNLNKENLKHLISEKLGSL